MKLTLRDDSELLAALNGSCNRAENRPPGKAAIHKVELVSEWYSCVEGIWFSYIYFSLSFMTLFGKTLDILLLKPFHKSFMQRF